MKKYFLQTACVLFLIFTPIYAPRCFAADNPRVTKAVETCRVHCEEKLQDLRQLYSPEIELLDFWLSFRSEICEIINKLPPKYRLEAFMKIGYLLAPYIRPKPINLNFYEFSDLVQKGMPINLTIDPIKKLIIGLVEIRPNTFMIVRL